MENMLRVGVITSTHGVRGEVKVFPTTDDAKRFKKLKTVILDTGKGQTTLEIEQVKFFKNMVILKFKGYDNINDVETWRQKDLLITREQAVTLQPDEYFITDLIGLLVKDDTGAEVGTVKDVYHPLNVFSFIVGRYDQKYLIHCLCSSILCYSSAMR